ncbi:uncharacterized protein TRUGW13939_07590 [Talaromyces rugulosus]|uniref:Metallo-beta-lactamase domain-containing protein n=1 Tax=Talaromyces rugulosus TaxID=121627 RepID=A0A7H8R4B8_TALRU|nr:uncharacterized protein TRUGW13939_07590 [Talaromyces rugulosus]QKX60445.1 hypothetical protein TRUGW13939_07590 [Talaromyces rugulosus]
MSSSTSAILYALTISATSPEPAVPDDAAGKPHHAKDGYTNPWESYQQMRPWEIARTMIGRRFSGEANVPDTTPPTVTVQKPTFLASREKTDTVRATWLGHACYYVEFPSGLRVLFDPVFEDRCSPFSWLGPKRHTEPPCQISEIPTIDVVVISHNHYDHLSLPSVTDISKRHPNCHFFVPLGNEQWFHSIGIKNVTELDWWDQRDFNLSPQTQQTETTEVEKGSTQSKIGEIVGRISCMPCQHISARSPFDQRKTLWASWGVESGGRNVYFAGDTGYRTVPFMKGVTDDHAPEHKFPTCPAFKQIGELRGPFDLGLIPIGAYEPRWIMSPMHADPHDAVNIFQDTKCQRALGMHWGTWVLTEEDVLEPPKKLKEALKRNDLPEEGKFDVCNIGESREF